jgi:hypothetical protein
MRRHIIILTAAMTFSSALASVRAEAQTPDGKIASACERVVRVFTKLDGEGAQLTPEGRRKIATLFTQPAAAHTDSKWGIVEDDVYVGPVTIYPDGRMHVGTQSLFLGTLTTGGAFPYDNSMGQIKMRADFVVSAAGPAGASPICKIEGAAPSSPQLTLSAAIRHVTALRDKARNAADRRRFTRALAGLERERPTPRGRASVRSR